MQPLLEINACLKSIWDRPDLCKVFAVHLPKKKNKEITQTFKETGG